MGAGNVNPSKAVDPGLVYDIVPDDNVRFLCGLGYSDKQVEMVTNRQVACAKVGKIRDVDLNYPAISVASSPRLNKITIIRTVKNISNKRSTYKVKVDGLKNVVVDVSPKTLEFSGERNLCQLRRWKFWPKAASLINQAPWVLTVAASTIDRNKRATVNLGNGVELHGESAYQPNNFPSAPLPLTTSGSLPGSNCGAGMIKANVRGKMVILLEKSVGSRIAVGARIKSLGGKAMLMVNDALGGYTTRAEAHHLPMSFLNYINGLSVFSYVNDTEKPVASIIFKGTIFKVFPAPTIASFSSRGLNSHSRRVLKPDILAPGVNILVASSTRVGSKPSNIRIFDMISRTSMATPHLSGVAALIKAVHPDWSPADIKSAIMTTADIIDENGNPINDEKHNKASFFAMGAGNVNPSKAVDPGLVYDIEPDDYVRFLCGLGYSDKQVEMVTNRQVACAKLELENNKERGIFVSCGGGNFGPKAASLINQAPWVLTVAASTIDRNIRATVKLGNGVELHGESAY
ncbi:subtilisin-like protease 1 [Curcuma longa]|uniref:subtilisin-like protease 1 n=1 Tax=Curcuma longa TaxID=136217 RepID=UPI003D9EA052